MSDAPRSGSGPERKPTGRRGWVRPTLGIVAAVAAAVAIAWLSRIPYTVHGDDAGMMRLSWRMAAPEVEECRELSPEERAGRPAHMREEEVCERRFPSYRLRAAVDGRTVADRAFQPGGIRGDRPFFIFEDVLMEPGRHAVEVRFEPVDDEGADLPRLAWEGEVGVGPREIVLITYERDGESLILRRGAQVGDPDENSALHEVAR